MGENKGGRSLSFETINSITVKLTFKVFSTHYIKWWWLWCCISGHKAPGVQQSVPFNYTLARESEIITVSRPSTAHIGSILWHLVHQELPCYDCPSRAVVLIVLLFACTLIHLAEMHPAFVAFPQSNTGHRSEKWAILNTDIVGIFWLRACPKRLVTRWS